MGTDVHAYAMHEPYTTHSSINGMDISDASMDGYVRHLSFVVLPYTVILPSPSPAANVTATPSPSNVEDNAPSGSAQVFLGM